MSTAPYNVFYGNKDRGSVVRLAKVRELTTEEMADAMGRKSMPLSMPVKFWICYIPGGLVDAPARYSFEAAREEAKRLARDNPNNIVYVLECVGRYETAYSLVIWKKTEGTK